MILSSYLSALPFALLLLAIAICPLAPRLESWWGKNRNKLIVSLALSAVIAIYYWMRGAGFEGAAPGAPSLLRLLHRAAIGDFFPFIVLLFSLFTISGGIRIHGDIPAHPATNVFFLFIGAVLASLIGTTGASMLLIRPLLEINRERKHVTMTAVFFIFIVSNAGGLLLPLGDPPLFLGYLYGVPFFWTLRLLPEWLFVVGALLAIYWVLDHRAYQHERPQDIQLDEATRVPIRVRGLINFVLLAGIVAVVAGLVPGKPIPGTAWVVPDIYLREWAELALAGLSLALTPRGLRHANKFSFHPIIEVAALFIGIFITMQAPIEILSALGPRLGIETPFSFFWHTGALSSVLDNAPTYLVFFALGGALPHTPDVAALSGLQTVTGSIAIPILKGISSGAVLWGAMTYIGNGPNFMVKSIAEHAGVPMPSFLKYMVYSFTILLPILLLCSLLLYW